MLGVLVVKSPVGTVCFAVRRVRGSAQKRAFRRKNALDGSGAKR